VLFMLLIGAAIGVLNGAAITGLQMPPFIVTLTTMMFFSGFAIWLTQSRNIYQLPAAFTGIGRNTGFAVAVAAVASAAVWLLLERSLAGRWIFAVGRNARTAFVSGVPVNRTLVFTYITSGILAAIASVLYTGRLETGSPVLGQRILLDVIGATVIGGTSLFGGKGKVAWTAAGVLFMTVVDNSLALLGLSNFAVLMAKGTVILAAALLDTLRTRYALR
jgi:ribose transport system permease protein